MNLCGFFDDENVFGHLRAADVVASPSTREWFRILYFEVMTTENAVIAADQLEPAANEVVADANFCGAVTGDATTAGFDAVLGGTRWSHNGRDRGVSETESQIRPITDTGCCVVPTVNALVAQPDGHSEAVAIG